MKSEPSFREGGGGGGGEKAKAGIAYSEHGDRAEFSKRGRIIQSLSPHSFLPPISLPPPVIFLVMAGSTRFIPRRSCQFERERSSSKALFCLFFFFINNFITRRYMYACIFHHRGVTTTRREGKASRSTSRIRAPSSKR